MNILLINHARRIARLAGARLLFAAQVVACYLPEVRAIVLSLAPGISDWAAILYRDESAILGRAADPERAYRETILPAKVDYYVRYVRERSFWTDLRINFSTLVANVH